MLPFLLKLLRVTPPLLGQYRHHLCEDIVDLILYSISEAVDGHRIRSFLSRQPDIMNIPLNLSFNLAA